MVSVCSKSDFGSFICKRPNSLKSETILFCKAFGLISVKLSIDALILDLIISFSRSCYFKAMKSKALTGLFLDDPPIKEFNSLLLLRMSLRAFLPSLLFLTFIIFTIYG